jgi:hypothetical protein
MKNSLMYLDDEEKDLMESVDWGEWKQVDNVEEEKNKAVDVAKATLLKFNLIKTKGQI